MVTKIRLIRTENHEDDHFIEVATGKRLERGEVAGNVNFTVVESIEESAGDRAARKSEPPTKTLKELKEAQVKSYLAMGLSEQEAKIAAGVEDQVLADPFANLLSALSRK